MKVIWSALRGHGLVEAHFAGQASPGADRRMWRHLRSCAECRLRYRTHALCEAVAPDGDAQAQDRLARAIFPTEEAQVRARRPMRFAAAGALIAAAAAIVVVPRLRDGGHDDGFRARGAAPAAQTIRPSIELFRVPPGGTPERAGAVVRAGDALAFAYRNPPAAAQRHLMIFARDQAGRVYWYWPAWRDPATTPTALAIAPAAAPVELRDEIVHPLPPGRLTLTALFSAQPHDVRAVEAALARGPAVLADLGVLVQEELEVLP